MKNNIQSFNFGNIIVSKLKFKNVFEFQYKSIRKNICLLIQGIVIGLLIIMPSSTQGVTESISMNVFISTAEDETQAAVISDDIDNEIDTYITASALSGLKDSTTIYVDSVKRVSPIVTIDKPDTLLYPKTFTIDYGATGITGMNGNILKGKIIGVVSKRSDLINSSRTVSFVDFYENGNAVKGTKTITFKGVNTAFLPYWTVSIKDTILRTDGTSVIWNSERLCLRISNNGTPLINSDDLYLITGSSNGISAKGIPYSLVIRNNYPVKIGGNWPFYVAGIVSLNVDNGNVVIDYGDGTKDKNSTSLVNGETTAYTFKY